MGIIYAIRALEPLEKFADELDRLNQLTPSSQWPDMLVVVSTGVINYAAQFPGEPISGDILPPAEGATQAYTAPIYVVMVTRPTGARSLNKMIAFLIAHLAIFSPGAKLPNFTELLTDVSKMAMALRSYQYNLEGQLLPVPREFYSDRYIPPFAPAPLNIEDRRGNRLAAVQFLPWQDGGVIILRGKLPLAGLLVLLGNEKLRRGGVINRDAGLQISYALPIDQSDFGKMLARFQNQSNMVIRKPDHKMGYQKNLRRRNSIAIHS